MFWKANFLELLVVAEFVSDSFREKLLDARSKQESIFPLSGTWGPSAWRRGIGGETSGFESRARPIFFYLPKVDEETKGTLSWF